MANHKSSEKRIRQTVKRTAVNRARVSRIRSSVKQVEAAIASGNSSEAKEALKNAQPVLMKGVSSGVIKKTTVSRKISRLSARVKALATA